MNHTTQQIATYMAASEHMAPCRNVYLGNDVGLFREGFLDVHLIAELVVRNGNPIPRGGFRYTYPVVWTTLSESSFGTHARSVGSLYVECLATHGFRLSPE